MSNLFRHLTSANLKILLRALRREPPRQILRNLRRLLSSKLPDNISKQGRKAKVDLYAQYLQRESNPQPIPKDTDKLRNWVFPHSDSYALASHAKAVANDFLAIHPEAEIIYCDEDMRDENGHRHTPYFKPGWSPENVLAVNYIGEPLAVRKDIWHSDQGIIWEFWLKAIEKKYQVVHLPAVLMHRVKETGNQPKDLLSETLQAHLHRQNIPAKVLPSAFNGRFNLPIFPLQWPDDGPLVSILIPSKNNHKLLKACLDALAKTTYKHVEILILDNASEDPQTLKYLEDLQKNPDIHILTIPNQSEQFSFSYINNEGTKAAHGELLLFLNDDTEVKNPRWLSQMVGYHRLDGVEMVGAKLLYPDGSVQHMGVGIGMYTGNFEGFPAHYFAAQKPDDPALVTHTHISSNVMAVTGACCLVSKKLFESLGGFDETLFPLSFNDIDLCLRIHQAGHRIVIAHDAVLIHKESKSRKGLTEYREMINYKRKYRGIKDAYYNPNFSLVKLFEINPAAAGISWPVFVNEIPDREKLMELGQAYCLVVPSHRMRTYIEKMVPHAVIEVSKKKLGKQTSTEGISKAQARAHLGLDEDVIVFVNYAGNAPETSHQVFNYAAEKLSKRYPDKFAFHLLTGQEEEDKWAFCAADVFVNTNPHSTEVGPLLLAMSLGLPIISYADIGMQEYLLEGQNGLLIPTGSKYHLLKAMEKFGTNVELRKTFGELSLEVMELNDK